MINQESTSLYNEASHGQVTSTSTCTGSQVYITASGPVDHEIDQLLSILNSSDVSLKVISLVNEIIYTKLQSKYGSNPSLSDDDQKALAELAAFAEKEGIHPADCTCPQCNY